MLDFLYTAVSWVLLRWHSLFSAIGIDEDSGLNWSLSIVFLVITARLLLFRVFIKQVHYQRRMQEMQPKLTEIRNKYKNDKAEQQRQMMKFQQEEGFNPITGCLPMFLQFPIFIALFHVLRHLSNSVVQAQQYRAYEAGKLTLTPAQLESLNHQLSLYSFTPSETASAALAKLFGAPLAGSLHDSAAHILLLGGDVASTRTVTLILVLISASATFYTQVLVRRAATVTPEGTAATVQKLMFVGIPISVLFSGFFFPLGVCLYWFTSNTWTMAQQLYINKFHPHNKPGEVEVVGAVGKTLAPKPGAKPQRRANVDLSKDAPTAGETAGDAAASPNGTAADSTPGAAPKPGARPNRSGTSKPANRPNNRPSQSKKRR
ncbi:YidC/Oxa1 family membrane protein insertase [Jatrophihabitans sp. GAS493]|uniref:membrane protein insertase YidC n=1 Tax=Jatrophihabitans sp. GAS493 TaxID=1907575 RepID=UPI000BB70070|nr:membrane protein insertase YidC [Jatrophihabitans sp. GAS493]SOD71228.1 YidC/Oxa1 family membrane protein insertase [Jatrophihabitans sp. GAS493]